MSGKGDRVLHSTDFTATWCEPCKIMAPIFAELAQKMTDAIFLKVDVDQLSSVATEWEVRALPTFMCLKDGKVVDKLAGANKARLQELVEKHAAAIAAA